ncbi:LysE/ArgO family amino acid transporter [Polyangium sp. y55x31]|uniref:LysE/ArgO family amino acid transporter n=1 Tax=Polyangium sp. y55x31 TaxID=3042688 RepID=UPI002482C5D5|nr:LysE/ArgO family amino acid transporter [Polyangium sp. y55x31]MDI1480367.1 LysE/ArgO family amino acid transporter [Polyangium sp. y55x31]
MASKAVVALLEGLALGASLIIAIGPQNAFVLRQGLVRRHIGPIVAICALSDAGLILVGAAGVGSLVNASSGVFTVLALGGAAFLTWYGISAMRRALAPSSLQTDNEAGGSLRQAVMTVLALTWLNPHVYLDTVVLLGGISGRYPLETRVFFACGAMLASLVWFAALGYGARLLAPIFRRPLAWRILDSLIALVMFTIAARLLIEGVTMLNARLSPPPR